MAKRKLDDWLTSHLEYTKNSESPLSFHTWSGISCIASALQRRVYLRWETQIFPNLYIICIGDSGRTRKGDPLNTARDYLEDISVNLLAEVSTPEAFIIDMKEAETSFMDESTGNWIMQSPCTAISEELAVILGQQNVQFLSFLTNWYDSRHKWVRRTKHQGTDTIFGICLNILASCAPDWLPGILTREAIGGGFTSRCIFVVEERKRQTILDPTIYRPDPKLRDALVHDLELMMMLTGEYKFSDKAKQRYMDWYEVEDAKLMSGENMFGDPALNGYVSRRATHLRKISMNMAASHSDKLVIDEEDFERARLLLEKAEEKMPKVFAGLGRSRYVVETELILSYMKAKRTVKRSELLKDLWRDIDEQAFNSILSVLTDMKAVEISIMAADGDNTYKYLGKTE